MSAIPRRTARTATQPANAPSAKARVPVFVMNARAAERVPSAGARARPFAKRVTVAGNARPVMAVEESVAKVVQWSFSLKVKTQIAMTALRSIAVEVAIAAGVMAVGLYMARSALVVMEPGNADIAMGREKSSVTTAGGRAIVMIVMDVGRSPAAAATDRAGATRARERDGSVVTIAVEMVFVPSVVDMVA